MIMKDELKKEVKYLLSQLENKKTGIHFSNYIPPYADSMIFAAYANEGFFSIILRLINSNEQNLEVKTIM